MLSGGSLRGWAGSYVALFAQKSTAACLLGIGCQTHYFGVCWDIVGHVGPFVTSGSFPVSLACLIAGLFECMHLLEDGASHDVHPLTYRCHLCCLPAGGISLGSLHVIGSWSEPDSPANILQGIAASTSHSATVQALFWLFLTCQLSIAGVCCWTVGG